MNDGLHYAIRQGNWERVRALLEAGDDANRPDYRGWSPLSRAIERRQPVIAYLLLEWGADVHASDRWGRQPLLWVAQYGPVELVGELLNRGAFANARDHYGKTPLVQAIRHRRTAIVERLLEWGEYESNDYFLSGAMFYAIRNHQYEIVTVFLKSGLSADSSIFDWIAGGVHEVTGLMEAVRLDDLRLVGLFTGHGADVTRKPNASPRSLSLSPGMANKPLSPGFLSRTAHGWTWKRVSLRAS